MTNKRPALFVSVELNLLNGLDCEAEPRPPLSGSPPENRVPASPSSPVPAGAHPLLPELHLCLHRLGPCKPGSHCIVSCGLLMPSRQPPGMSGAGVLPSCLRRHGMCVVSASGPRSLAWVAFPPLVSQQPWHFSLMVQNGCRWGILALGESGR